MGWVGFEVGSPGSSNLFTKKNAKDSVLISFTVILPIVVRKVATNALCLKAESIILGYSSVRFLWL